MQKNSDIVTLLKTKLDHIEQDCESEVRAKVDAIYSTVKFENGRLRIPNFNKVANIMVEVIRLKEKRFSSEISRILNSTHGFNDLDELERAKALISSYFHDERYLNRLDGFIESVERAASRCGGHLERTANRTDSASALFSVGVKNSNRRAISSVQTELDLHMTPKQPLLPDRSPPCSNQEKQNANRKKVFIGHGLSPLWRELKDFLHNRLHLDWEEFNREPQAGIATTERLQQMLDASCIAFLVMTAEDQHANSTLHARENVVHEVGL
jgi:hypothetical protein